MAQKYLKYFVTRENQNLTNGFVEYMVKFPEHKHLLNTMSVHTWHLYDMIQDAFYCNWPNTNFKKYFVNAEPVVVQSTTRVTDARDHEYCGVLFVNPNGNKVSFSVNGQTQEIELNDPTILISPHHKEEFTVTCDGQPLLMILIRIHSSLREEENWIPF